MESYGDWHYFGLFLTIFWIKAPRWLTTGIYLGMGWIVLIAIYPIIVTFKSLGQLRFTFVARSWSEYLIQ